MLEKQMQSNKTARCEARYGRGTVGCSHAKLLIGRQLPPPPHVSDNQAVTGALAKQDYSLHCNTQIAGVLDIGTKNSKLRHFFINSINSYWLAVATILFMMCFGLLYFSEAQVRTVNKADVKQVKTNKTTNYYCKWCGMKYSSVSNLTSGYCSKNPNSKKHELYEGSEKSQYICKYCGMKYSSLSNLCSGYCSKNPHKKHHPAL